MQNQAWVDPYGSVFKKYPLHLMKKKYTHKSEGIGEDIIPKNVDFELIDLFEKVSDKDAALMTRELAKEEGILAGYSCGAALRGVIQLKNKLKENDIVVSMGFLTTEVDI